jgi:CheY-like chemotaxis protein/DNA-binding XRE family transcriptional regulator
MHSNLMRRGVLTIEEAFGIVLRRLRRERNLTQDGLSDLSSVDRSFISNIEGGKQQPSLLTIYELAKTLNVSASSIIFEVDFLITVNSPEIIKSNLNNSKYWINCMEIIMDDVLDKYTGNETILLADDENYLRELMSQYLTDCGYKVILAEDGQYAIEKFKLYNDNIHLVILDVVMPRKDGISTYKEIKSMNPNALIFLMSGYHADLVNKEDKFPIIQKPFSPVELIKKVRTTLNSECSA